MESSALVKEKKINTILLYVVGSVTVEQTGLQHMKATRKGYSKKYNVTVRRIRDLRESYHRNERESHRISKLNEYYGVLRGFGKNELDPEGHIAYIYEDFDFTLAQYIKECVEKFPRQTETVVTFAMRELLIIINGLHEDNITHGALELYDCNIVVFKDPESDDMVRFNINVVGLMNDKPFSDTKDREAIVSIFTKHSSMTQYLSFISLMTCIRTLPLKNLDRSFYFLNHEEKLLYLKDAWSLVAKSTDTILEFNRHMGNEPWYGELINGVLKDDAGRKEKVKHVIEARERVREIFVRVYNSRLEDVRNAVESSSEGGEPSLRSQHVQDDTAAGFLNFCRNVVAHHVDVVLRENEGYGKIISDDGRIYNELYSIWSTFFDTLHEKLAGAKVEM